MLVVAEPEQLPVPEARAGDPDAWAALFRRYQLPLYVYVFELVHNEQTSLDIVQETFINAVRYLPNLREDEKFGSWLFGIAHQKCIQTWRRQGREREFADSHADAAEDYEPAPSELLIQKEQEEEFMRLISQLPLAHRSVLLLHFVEDFSLEQIAEITGSQTGTVKSRMYYAKKGLRKLLEENEEL
jgi:RNA polymerase sigma-70 factor (ECF subfamily)